MLPENNEKISGGEPAMPHPNHEGRSGLSIRQHFASMAMQGLITADLASERDASVPVSSRVIASLSVTYADALIAELNK